MTGTTFDDHRFDVVTTDTGRLIQGGCRTRREANEWATAQLAALATPVSVVEVPVRTDDVQWLIEYADTRDPSVVMVWQGWANRRGNGGGYRTERAARAAVARIRANTARFNIRLVRPDGQRVDV